MFCIHFSDLKVSSIFFQNLWGVIHYYKNHTLRFKWAMFFSYWSSLLVLHIFQTFGCIRIQIPLNRIFAIKTDCFFIYYPMEALWYSFHWRQSFSRISFSSFILFPWSEIDLMLFYKVKRKHSIRTIVIVKLFFTRMKK